MSGKLEKKRLTILRIIQEANKPIGSLKITEQLLAKGYEVSARSVRWYLQGLDKEGLTENLGRRGRRITKLGLKEIQTAKAIEKVGVLAAKIDQITYSMDFNLSRKTGTVVLNMSIIDRAQLVRAVPLISRVFSAGYAMGKLMGLFNPGERIGEILVPEGCIGIGTVCSVTINGILLAHGIPVNSRFGGLLELKDNKPVRFAELIYYEGTTLDPLEIFTKIGMTDYIGATENGNGRICASFREVPAESRDRVIALSRRVEKASLGGFFMIGWPGQPLLEIPVSEGRIGAIVLGGLNPIAILEEYCIRSYSRALAALADYRTLFHYKDLDTRIQNLI